MQNQRHMWRTARKSDYGTDATGVVFCVKRRTSVKESRGQPKTGALKQAIR